VDLLQWLERTFGVIQPHRDFLKRPLPPRVGYAYCLGGVALCAALLSALTGMLLSLYYVPSAREAYQSVVLIHQELRLGWLVRSTHKWSGAPPWPPPSRLWVSPWCTFFGEAMKWAVLP